MADEQADLDSSQDPAVLAARVRALGALVAEQAQIIAALRAEVAELRRRLGQTSKTSHRPPSSDGPRKPPRPARLRQAGARPPGKQPGRGDVAAG